ncbi:sensor histidine kinase [Runella zeae]|uniref:sensor histidine kinase n=1 Tax=Runella zeae TaxID=94255 RepID=UPI002353F7A1|nr:histidine kinase [Runella zeae]
MSHWFFKYKLHHIPFWIANHLAWMMINVGSFEGVINYLFKGELPVKFIGYIIFQAAGAYFILYYLIPKFLYVGKYRSYILAVLLTVLVCTAFITAGYFLNAYYSKLTFFELFNKRPDQWFVIFSTAAFPSTVGSMTLAMSIKLGKNWLEAEKRRIAIEKDQLETELKYLKSQINPHFLFNTINSIFVLIHKNPDLASESLASFSEMLRYQLYECNDEKILLSKDLQFLENFIELETLRLNENQTELVFELNHESARGHQISPFILLPFVENAFKHVSKGKTQANFIKLILFVTPENVLHLYIKNSRDEKISTENSGIGLKNIQRRLNLIYPNRHTLEIELEIAIFKVSLKINL